MGYLAFGALCMLAMLSLPVIRRRAYTLFIHSHWAGLIIMIVTSCLHVPACIPWCIAAAAIYVADQLARLVKSHIVTARLECVQEIGCTRVSVPGLVQGWRAGQHVRVRVLTTGLGPIGWAECHPFTVSFHVLVSDEWTYGS